MSQTALVGRRVLVVEDEPVIAMMQASVLRSAGCVVVGPARGVRHALTTIAREPIDLALLDVNLGDENVFPVADALAVREVPFVFLTGYGREALRPEHRGRPCLLKPCDQDELLDALSDALAVGQHATD